jgi:hypothetical protein
MTIDVYALAILEMYRKRHEESASELDEVEIESQNQLGLDS